MEDFFSDRLFRALEQADPEPGSLLISAPGYEDGFLTRSVLLVVERTPEQTMTVALNMRGDVAVANVLEQFVPLVATPQAFYVGGQDAPTSLIGLGLLKPGTEVPDVPFLQHLGSRIVVMDLRTDVAELTEHVQTLRLFAGYTGFPGRTLDDAIAQGNWYVTSALASDIIAPGSVDLWAEVLRRQPMPLPLFATFPIDLEDN